MLFSPSGGVKIDVYHGTPESDELTLKWRDIALDQKSSAALPETPDHDLIHFEDPEKKE